MKAIIDSGPLIALGKLNILYLLESLFDKIIIPDIVYKEVITVGKKLLILFKILLIIFRI